MSRATGALLAGGILAGAVAWSQRRERMAAHDVTLGWRTGANARALATSQKVVASAIAAEPATNSEMERARRARVCGDPTLPAFRTPGRWVWPLATWRGRLPVCSDGWGSARTGLDGTPKTHLGVDLMYRRASVDELADTFPPGTRGGSKWHVMPADIPAIAASAGTVRYARWTARGFTVVLDHIAPWSTYYTHLATLWVQPGQQVVAGAPVGVVGGDPTNAPHLRHLHFALWRGQWQDTAVNPAPLMASWDVLSSPALPPRAAA